MERAIHKTFDMKDLEPTRVLGFREFAFNWENAEVRPLRIATSTEIAYLGVNSICADSVGT